MPVANSGDWTDCELIVEAKWLVKETEKSWCYKLWEKKFTVFPKRFMKGRNETTQTHRFYMPKWFVEKNGVKSLMDKEVRELLFPPKRKQKVKEPMTLIEPNIDPWCDDCRVYHEHGCPIPERFREPTLPDFLQ